MIKGFEIKNVTDSSADLYVSGEICDDEDRNFLSWFASDDEGNINGYVFPVDVKSQLNELKGKTLNVYINSIGGSVFAGTAIANMIARHDAPTNAFVDGVAASAATSIFFACDNKNMPSNAYLMIHKPSLSMSGNSDDLLKAADWLDIIQRGMENLYRKNANADVTDSKITELVNNETWLTGKEAAELFNITVTDSLDAVACFGSLPKNIKNIPKNIQFCKEPMDLNIHPTQHWQDDKRLKNTVVKQKNNIAIALAMSEIL